MGIQGEESGEGGSGALFGVDQATEIDKQLSARARLESSDQCKLRSSVKGLKSQKNLENDNIPKAIAKAHCVLTNHDYHKFEKRRESKGKGGDKRKKKSKIAPIPASQSSTNKRRLGVGRTVS